MKNNKRTVWFLTLLSLVAVISIYYINQKAPMPFDGLAIFDSKENPVTMTETSGDPDKQQPVFAESYLFEDMRMEVRNERSQLSEQLRTKIDSADYTTAEKNEAYEEMEAITKRDSAESLMEMQIIALGYPDAFVRTDGSTVNVTVLSEEGQSKQQANEITRLVISTWEEARKVEVKFEGAS